MKTNTTRLQSKVFSLERLVRFDFLGVDEVGIISVCARFQLSNYSQSSYKFVVWGGLGETTISAQYNDSSCQTEMSKFKNSVWLGFEGLIWYIWLDRFGLTGLIWYTWSF